MINVVVATHGEMAKGLQDSIRMVAGEFEGFHSIVFTEESGIDALRDQFKSVMTVIDKEHQWLILCDIMGGSPFKVASEFSYQNEDVSVYYGVNLPLTIEILLSREGKSLEEMKASLTDVLPIMVGLSPI